MPILYHFGTYIYVIFFCFCFALVEITGISLRCQTAVCQVYVYLYVWWPFNCYKNSFVLCFWQFSFIFPPNFFSQNFMKSNFFCTRKYINLTSFHLLTEAKANSHIFAPLKKSYFLWMKPCHIFTKDLRYKLLGSLNSKSSEHTFFF